MHSVNLVWMIWVWVELGIDGVDECVFMNMIGWPLGVLTFEVGD